MREPREFIQREALPQLELLGLKGTKRLFQAFDGLEAEADAIADEAFQAFGQLPGEGDPADYAEDAQEEGLEYYLTFKRLEQGVTNLLAVGLHHLNDQLWRQFEALLAAYGLEVPRKQEIPQIGKLDELRWVANTIKHAEGHSAQRVRELRPDLFELPILRGSKTGRSLSRLRRPVEASLMGDDLQLTRADLDQYYEALRGYWICIEQRLA